jgi:hypothetical protein
MAYPKPASRLVIPKQFGRRPDAEFVAATTPDEEIATRSARTQHAAAVAALDALSRRQLSLTWLADALGEHPDHLRRKLYGQVQASLRDLATWEVVLALPAGTALSAPAPRTRATPVATRTIPTRTPAPRPPAPRPPATGTPTAQRVGA